MPNKTLQMLYVKYEIHRGHRAFLSFIDPELLPADLARLSSKPGLNGTLVGATSYYIRNRLVCAEFIKPVSDQWYLILNDHTGREIGWMIKKLFDDGDPEDWTPIGPEISKAIGRKTVKTSTNGRL
jgi:hypothetical protein